MFRYLISCIAAMGVHAVQPHAWQRMALEKTGNLWTPSQQLEIRDRINAVDMARPFLQYWWEDPERPFTGEDVRKPNTVWEISDEEWIAGFRILPEDLRAPILAFAKKKFAEARKLGFRFRGFDIHLRSEKSLMGFYSGHSHDTRKEITWLRTERGTSTRYRSDGGPWETPVEELVHVPEDHTLRMSTTWHAEPRLSPEEQRVLVIVTAWD